MYSANPETFSWAIVHLHDFVQDEHARICRTFIDDIFKEFGSTNGGRIGTKGLLNRVDIIVNCLLHLSQKKEEASESESTS